MSLKGLDIGYAYEIESPPYEIKREAYMKKPWRYGLRVDDSFIFFLYKFL